MFKSLRSRLLASYLVLIIMLLAMLVLAVVYQTATPAKRSAQAGAELNLVSRAVMWGVQQAKEQSGNSQKSFENSLGQIGDQARVRILWVDRTQGEIIYDSENKWTTKLINRNVIQQSRDSVVRHHAEDQSWWIFYTPSSGVTEQTFIVLAKAEPAPMIYFNQVFAEPLWRSAALATLLAFVLAVLIARSVAKPLQKMADAAHAVAEGDYEQKLPLEEGPSEVRSVASSFNYMTQQVKETQQAQRDFVANVSHDLKTPLTSIQGWSLALLDGTADDVEMQRHASEVIHKEAARMSRMVYQLLDLAKLEAGDVKLKQQPLFLTELLTSVHDNLLPQAQTSWIDFKLDLMPFPKVDADRDLLMQLFTNLADNALTYTPMGGRVILRAYAKEKQAIIEVEDNGEGISEEKIGRIFERFYQVDESRKRTRERDGTGLGLAICRNIAHAHKGTISVASQLEVGTTFTVILPLPEI